MRAEALPWGAAALLAGVGLAAGAAGEGPRAGEPSSERRPRGTLALREEVGSNDFRLSDMAGVGSPCVFCAIDAAVAYNPLRREYLVVWSGWEGPGEGFEIYAQRLDGATGAELGANDFRVSRMGGAGHPLAEAFLPAVAFNPLREEFLIAWSGDPGIGGLADEEFEIFGQRLAYDAAGDLVEVGTDDFRLSHMGPPGDSDFVAAGAAIAHRPVGDEFLVVWTGEDDAGGQVDGEFEIFGQRLAYGAGDVLVEAGADDFRLSDVGRIGEPAFDAGLPALAYNCARDEYLVVWEGDEIGGGLVEGEFEIFGQRLAPGPAGDLVEVGTNDFRVSAMGGTGNPDYAASDPALAYNPARDEYLVVWNGDDDIGGQVDGEEEIFAQRLGYDGAGGLVEVGADDLRVSTAGPSGNISFDARHPAVAWSATADEYLVVWDGDDDFGGLVEGELEIHGQRLDGATGAELGADDERLSDMGTVAGPGFEGRFPAVAYGAGENGYLVVWEGDDDQGGLINGDHEIFGQRLWFPLFADGFESGDLGRWSLSVP